jgi:hypothetical protein
MSDTKPINSPYNIPSGEIKRTATVTYNLLRDVYVKT